MGRGVTGYRRKNVGKGKYERIRGSGEYKNLTGRKEDHASERYECADKPACTSTQRTPVRTIVPAYVLAGEHASSR